MLNVLVELAKTGGKVAREHFAHTRDTDVFIKGDRDYVSRVDRLVERTIVDRIKGRWPDHRILGEEGEAGESAPDPEKPLWIIDPIDGTTNFIHGIPAFAVSIAWCDRGYSPRYGVVYDPMRDECFSGERGAGLWLNDQRMNTSGRRELRQSLVATALPFRFPEAMDDCLRVFGDVQRACDDQRRGGSAALDLAYVAVGRLDAYYELGIYPWDTAAGELLVRCGGGMATDWRGREDGILGRRSILAAASRDLHDALAVAIAPALPWTTRKPFG